MYKFAEQLRIKDDEVKKLLEDKARIVAELRVTLIHIVFLYLEHFAIVYTICIGQMLQFFILKFVSVVCCLLTAQNLMLPHIWNKTSKQFLDSYLNLCNRGI